VPWLVHLLTASGAVIAWLAVRATEAGDLRAAFLWLATTTAIDAIDGWLARRVRIKQRLPFIDGARLDDVVDYVTFVFVPAWMIGRLGLVPLSWTLPVVAAVLLSSAYGFSQTQAKTSDHFFTGFPSYWNIVVLYLVVLGMAAAVNAVLVLALAALVFVPIRYVYPSRTPTLRPLTVALGLVWGAACLLMIARMPGRSPWLAWSSLSFPAYYVVLSLVLNRRRQERAITA
jgi:phosphatidylcholine synthase